MYPSLQLLLVLLLFIVRWVFGAGPQIAELNVLLPPRMTHPVEYRLQGSNGCFSWSWDHHDVLSVQPEYNGTSSCSTGARLISIAPYSGRKETAVYATDLISGAFIRCEVFIDKISRIRIFHHSIKLDLHGLTTLRVHAFDEEENVFSSLAGLQFTWKLIPESFDADGIVHHLAHVPLKDTPLSDCGGFCGDLNTQIKLEQSGVGSDLYVVRGIEIGHEIVSVHLLEPQLEHVADEIALTIVEAISLDPPSPVFVLIGTYVHYTLRVIHQNTPQAVRLPSPYHRWSLSNTTVANINSTLGCVHSLNLGTTNVIVEDTRVAGHVQISSMHVVLPEKLHLYMIPVAPSYESLEDAKSSSSTVVWHIVEGQQYVVYPKVFSHGPDVQEILITKSNRIKLQFNDSLYWDTLSIPDDVAGKNGWRNSLLIKATSCGVGSLVASLAYHNGSMESIEVMVAVQEIEVCEQLRISSVDANELAHIILLPWAPGVYQEVQLAATGGCAETSEGYFWFSSDLSIVSVSAAGFVRANKPGQAIIKAVSNFDPHNYDEVVIEVSLPSSMAVLRNSPVEVVVGTYLQAAATLKSASGNFYYRCDAFNSFIRWQLLSGSEYFQITNSSEVWTSTMPHVGFDSLYGSPCAWKSLYASNAGRSIVEAAFFHDLWSPSGQITLRTNAAIAAYQPLIAHQAGDGNRFGGYWVDLTRLEADTQDMVSSKLDVLYLVPGTGSYILLVGGPERWNQGVEFIDNVEVLSLDEEVHEDRVLVEEQYASGGKLYNILCQAAGNFKVVFSRGNLVGDDHPLPVISDAEVSVTCDFPSSIVLIANEPVNKPNLILSATQVDRGPGKIRTSPITVANTHTIRMSAVGIHHSGKAFANASSLCLKWELSHCDDLANWEDNGNIECCVSSWERFLILQNATGKCFIRATVAGLVSDGIGNLVQNASSELESMENVLTDAIYLQVVSSLRVIPESMLLFIYPDAKVSLSVTGGTCFLDAVVNDTAVIEVIQPPSSLQCSSLTLAIRGLGSALVTVYDVGLAVPTVASTLVQVADVDRIKIASNEDIWLMEGSTQSLDILAGIHDGRAFDSSQYAYMNIHLLLEDGILELVDNDGFSRHGAHEILGPTFLIRAAKLGITALRVLARQKSGEEISSQVIKVEVYAPLRIHPGNIFLAPGASFMLSVRGGPIGGAVIEYASMDDLTATIHRSSGRLSAISLGNTTLSATAYGNGGAIICEAYGRVEVGIPSAMAINLQNKQIGIGCKMPIYLSSSQGNLFSFYELCKDYKWTTEDEQVLSFKSSRTTRNIGFGGIESGAVTPSDFSVLNDYDFVNVLHGRSSGRTTVAVSFTCDFVSPRFPSHSVSYEASERVTVVSDPPLALGVPMTWALPPFYTSSNLLPMSLDSYREGNSHVRKGSIFYSVLRTCGSDNKPLKQESITVDGGRILTKEGNHLACIQAKDQFTGIVAVATCVRVAEVAQIQVFAEDFPSHVAHVAVGGKLKLLIYYADVLGNPFHEASGVVEYHVETNYPDVISIEIPKEENTTDDAHGIFYIEALRHGRALVQISMNGSSAKAAYMLIQVGAHIDPQNPVLHVGEYVNFNVIGDGNIERASGKWFSGNESVISVNGPYGEAHAIGQGLTYILFETASLRLQTSVLVLMEAQILVEAPLETLTNVPFPAKGYKFTVGFSDTHDEKFEAATNGMQVPHDCRIDPAFIGYTKPWKDVKNGKLHCLFFPHSPEHFHSMPKVKSVKQKVKSRDSGGLYFSMIASLRQKPQVTGYVDALFIGGFSIVPSGKMHLTSVSNTSIMTIIGNTDVEITWHAKEFFLVSPLRSNDSCFGGHRQYEVKVLHGESFVDKIIISLPSTGQTEEIEVSYVPKERSDLKMTNGVVWVAVVGCITVLLLTIFLFSCLLDRPNGLSQSAPVSSVRVIETTPDRSSSENLLHSPQTQPFVDYVKRTIDETPYYRRGRRRFDPQNTY